LSYHAIKNTHWKKLGGIFPEEYDQDRLMVHDTGKGEIHAYNVNSLTVPHKKETHALFFNPKFLS